MFVSEPAEPVRSRICSVAVAPASSWVIFQVRAPALCASVPVEGVNCATDTLAGRLLLSLTKVARPGPLFDTIRVKVRLLPKTAGNGAAVCVRTRSAAGHDGYKVEGRTNQM